MPKTERGLARDLYGLEYYSKLKMHEFPTKLFRDAIKNSHVMPWMESVQYIRSCCCRPDCPSPPRPAGPTFTFTFFSAVHQLRLARSFLPSFLSRPGGADRAGRPAGRHSTCTYAERASKPSLPLPRSCLIEVPNIRMTACGQSQTRTPCASSVQFSQTAT